MQVLRVFCLGSAAAVVAIAGAQAADLPVKAKPVEYVKVCSLYGAGFYYIPGTDTCIKVGGYVRFEAYHNSIGAHAPFLFNNSQAAFTRHTDTFAMRGRGMLTADARSQTSTARCAAMSASASRPRRLRVRRRALRPFRDLRSRLKRVTLSSSRASPSV